MGTTLTGTTPQDTYDSLIKVTDNGPLSGTAKYLSDGLGNDSALAVSTSAVGVGTSSLFAELQVNKASDVTLALSNSTAVTSGNRGSLSFYNSAVSTVALIKATAVTDNVGTQLEFYTRPAAGSLAQTMTITSEGIVGIGTSTPSAAAASYGGLDIRGASGGGVRYGVEGGFNMLTYATGTATDFVPSAASDIRFFNKTGITESIRFQSAGGISFNGDTAQANALDDYEEGTWTPNFTLSAGSVSAYTSSGSYTKIGRQVSVTLSLVFTTTSSAQIDYITGLPFTAENTAQVAIGAVRENGNTGDMWQWRVSANGTSGVLRRYDNDNALANDDSFFGTLTYFV